MENVHLPSAELCQNLYESNCNLASCISGTRRQWQRGQLEFEAMMRQLDIAVSSTITSLIAVLSVITLPLLEEQGIMISLFLCLSVCLSVC